MIQTVRKSKKTRKKQPKRRKVESTSVVGLPKIEVPGTAKKRRRRNKRSLRVPGGAIKQVITSPRWMSLILLLVCLFALLLVGSDQAFYFSSIPIEGNSSIADSEIIAASGLAGKHVFASDPTGAAAQIGEIPGVISATVTLGWPNEAVIRIAEESPIAIWQQGGKSYWITPDNRLIASRTNNMDLLRIESETARKSEENLFVPEDVIEGALNLKALRPNISHLFFRPGSGLSFQDGRGWRVFFGTGPGMEQRLVVYEAIVADLLERGVTPSFVNVSNQAKPYYMADSG